MQTNELINGITETEDSSYMESGTDILDFLNTSDTENEDIKDIIGNEPDKSTEEDPCNEEASSLTLSITNVVVMASLQCHLRLKEIARTSVNVEYKPLQNVSLEDFYFSFTILCLLLILKDIYSQIIFSLVNLPGKLPLGSHE